MSKNDGAALRKYLRDNNINQADFAVEAGVSRNTLINYFKYSELPKDFVEFLTSKKIDLGKSTNSNDKTPTIEELLESKNYVIKLLNEKCAVLEENIVLIKEKLAICEKGKSR